MNALAAPPINGNEHSSLLSCIVVREMNFYTHIKRDKNEVPASWTIYSYVYGVRFHTSKFDEEARVLRITTIGSDMWWYTFFCIHRLTYIWPVQITRPDLISIGDSPWIIQLIIFKRPLNAVNPKISWPFGHP